MQNLQNIKTADLILKIKNLVSEERRLGVEILWHLKEIDARRTHLEMGYPSLHEFAVRELGYSDGATHRRIASMRALRDLPQVEEKLNNGALSLTTLSAAQDFFSSEKKDRAKIYTKEERAEVLKQIEHKSKRECLEVFASISPASVIPKESARPLSADATELRLVLDNETLELLKRVKDLTAMKNSDAIKYALKRTLDQIDPLRKAERIEAKRTKKTARETANAPVASEKVKNPAIASPEKLEGLRRAALAKLVFSKKVANKTARSKAKRPNISATLFELAALEWANSESRYPSASLRREVWKKGHGRCQFIGTTGRPCNSTFRPEVDHVQPYALGGKTEPTNLQLLCARHNKYRAAQTFGKRVSRHENSLRK